MERYWHGLENISTDRNKDIEALSMVCHSGLPLFANQYFSFFQKRAVKTVLERERMVLKHKSLLDIGCGGGRWANFFKQYGAEVTGIDIQKKTISQNKGIFPNIDFRVMSAMDLDFPDCFFDVISCITVLQHIPYENQIEAVDELVRVTKPNGYILILEWTHNSDASHMFPRQIDEWLQLFDKKGFTLVNKKSVGYDLIFQIYNKFSHFIRKSLKLSKVKHDDFNEKLSKKISENWRSKLRNIISVIITVISYPCEVISEYIIPDSAATHTLMLFKKN